MEFNLKQSYKNLQIIYLALITGIVLFQVVTVHLNGWKIPEFREGLDTLNLVSLAALLMIPLGKMISEKKLKTIDPGEDVFVRITKLQSSFIIRWAFIEGPALLSIVTFLILQDGRHLVIFFICLVFFFLANPTKERFTLWAKLTEAEKLELG